MRVILFLAVLLVCGQLEAQSDPWSRLYSVPPGTQLVVTTWHRAPCEMERVAEEGMECGYRGGRYWVDRARIVQVSLAKRFVAVPVSTLAGAAALGLPLAIRQVGDSDAKAFAGVVGGVIGGWVGYGIGHLVRRPEGPILYECCLTSP